MRDRSEFESMRGIIFTNDEYVGMKKLDEILREKLSQGIKCVRHDRLGSYCNYIMRFSDGEIWRIISPHDKTARALRWNLAYIDAYNVTLDSYMNVIVPSGDSTMVEEPKYFNWDDEYLEDLVTGKQQEFEWIEEEKNIMEMKKLEEITLKDIKDYLYDNDCDETIAAKIVTENDVETLQILEFDGHYDDDVLVCSIYKKNGDFIVCRDDWMVCPFNHADGIEYDDEENELFKISTIVAGLLGVAKTSLCESIDYLQRQVDFINRFCNKNHLNNPSVTTTCEIEHE